MARRPLRNHIDSPVALGRRLRASREKVGMSQRDLSFDGCTAAYISRIEKGERVPSLQLLQELAVRLSVTSSYLGKGKEDDDSEGLQERVTLLENRLSRLEALFNI